MIELLRTRRSIRRFQARLIEPEKLAVLKESVLRSPSSRGFNPWEFVFVDDGELLEKLAACKPHGASFLKGCPLGIVIVGDEKKSDVWVEDCSIAALIAHLTAHSLGLGSCWVQIRKRMHRDEVSAEKYVQDLLGIPSHLRLQAIVAVGYPAEEKEGHPQGSLDFGKIHAKRFS